MTQIPAEAYPVAVYSADTHLTLDRIRVEATETAHILWIDGLMIGVSRDADDTRMRAALNISYAISQACERFAANTRADMEQRNRTRAAEPTQAALRALQHSHTAQYSQPYPPPPPDVLTSLLTTAAEPETEPAPTPGIPPAPAADPAHIHEQGHAAGQVPVAHTADVEEGQ